MLTRKGSKIFVNENVLGTPTSRDTLKKSTNVFALGLKEDDVEHLQKKAHEINTLLMDMLHLKNSDFVISYIDTGLFITFNGLDEDDYCIAVLRDRFNKVNVHSISKEKVLQEYLIDSYVASAKVIASTVASIIKEDNIL